MKKTIAALLALLSVLTILAACGKKPAEAVDAQNEVVTDADVPVDIGVVLPEE